MASGQNQRFAQQQKQAVFVRYFNYINIRGDISVLEELPFCSLTALTTLVSVLMSLISIKKRESTREER